MIHAPLFAWLQVIVCLGACAQYAYRLDGPHAIYWFAAALLTTSVNFMGN